MQAAKRLVQTSIVGSAVLCAALAKAALASRSEIALAQAADSLSDVLTASALLWAYRISLKPPDADHHFGHHSAQPAAALIVAVLAGGLAIEVAREAVGALMSPREVMLGWTLVAVLAAKAVFKAVVARLATMHDKRRPSSALRALRVDARNDVVLGVASVGGVLGARYAGLGTLDAWLAIPVAAWIGVSAVLLGVESLRLLMGVAPSADRQDELMRIAQQVPGVRKVNGIKARYQGNLLHVWLEVHVDPRLSVGAGHDVGEAVEGRLANEPDVCEAVVHVDAA